MVEPFLQVELDTFTPLEERPEHLTAWAERLRSELDRVCAPSDGELDLVWTSGRDRSVDLSPRAWRNALRDLGNGTLAFLGLQLGDSGGFEIEATPIGPADAARRLTFRVLPDPAALPERQARVVRLAKELATEVEAATGLITLDRVTGGDSPYERAITADSTETRRRARELVHGYYWGTFLSETHVERLGGVARVRAEAPVALVEQLDQLTYLQLTERVDDTPESSLRALRAFLEPLLPPGCGSPPFDPLPPLRVLPEDLERPRPTADVATTRPATGRGPALVFKHEDENEHGEPIGPAIFNEDERVDDLGWMTLAEARALATERGWRFAEN
jgi:hypothetical protein